MQTIGDLKKILKQKWPEAAFSPAHELLFHTGLETLDSLLPNRGIPFGQLIEITGTVSSGKTSLLYKMLAQITASGSAAYIDLNNTFFPSAAAYYGADLNRIIIIQPDNVITAVRAAELLFQYQKTSCVIIDLIAEKSNLPPTLFHRLRTQTVKNKGLVIFLTEDNLPIIPASTVSLRLMVTRLDSAHIEMTVTKSRISKEGLKARMELYA